MTTETIRPAGQTHEEANALMALIPESAHLWIYESALTSLMKDRFLAGVAKNLVKPLLIEVEVDSQYDDEGGTYLTYSSSIAEGEPVEDSGSGLRHCSHESISHMADVLGMPFPKEGDPAALFPAAQAHLDKAGWLPAGTQIDGKPVAESDLKTMFDAIAEIFCLIGEDVRLGQPDGGELEVLPVEGATGLFADKGNIWEALQLYVVESAEKA